VALERSADAPHLSYISDNGRPKIETDEGERVSKAGQKGLLRDWHLWLSAGQYLAQYIFVGSAQRFDMKPRRAANVGKRGQKALAPT
jgi:hypothetical protein